MFKNFNKKIFPDKKNHIFSKNLGEEGNKKCLIDKIKKICHKLAKNNIFCIKKYLFCAKSYLINLLKNSLKKCSN